MKDYVQLWYDHLRARHRDTVPGRIEVVGQANNHGDPNWPKAVVRLEAEPAETFEVVDEVKDNFYADDIIIGLLNVLMTARWSPILKVKVTIKEVKIDPIESNRLAFQIAGRAAGEKLLAAMKQH